MLQSRRVDKPMKLPEVQVNRALRPRLAEGHPWVYRNQVLDAPHHRNGTWVRVRCGGWQAIGLWDDASPIAIRIFSRSTPPDSRWIKHRVRAAYELRTPVRSQHTTAWRWIFGESDGLPGITVDRYGLYAVIHTYADSVEVLIPQLIESLQAEERLEGILIRRRPAARDGEDAASSSKVERLWGAWPPRDLIIAEHGLRFRANLFAGQKTGLFLDHRDNRLTLQGLCVGTTVLNCFAYTGAFSVYAARGGARQIVSCDIAPDAIADARVNFELNGYDPTAHEFIARDVFDLLAAYAGEGRSFDVVVLDPPSFARARKHVEVAVRAYTRLNRLAIQCVRPGGYLASASCTSQVSPEMFRGVLAAAAAHEDRRLTLIHEAGQPIDHPVAAHFPEGRYLKFVIGRVGDAP
jgi:23S rRNA (cytosine1962-C5)-methyltransferase